MSASLKSLFKPSLLAPKRATVKAMESTTVAPHIANFLRAGHYALPAAYRRSAQLQLIAIPLAMAGEIWLTQGSQLLVLLMVEVLLCALFAARELLRQRENARRNAFGVALLNTLLLVVIGGIAGNVLMVLCAALFGLGTVLLLLRYGSSRRRLFAAWLLFSLGIVGALGLPAYGQWRVQSAAEAWQAGEFQAALDDLDGIEPLLWIKGGSAIEGALIQTRRAEMALRLEQFTNAERLAVGLMRRAKKLPAPIEAGDDIQMLRASLAFVIYEHGAQGIDALLFGYQRFGRVLRIPDRLLGYYQVYPSDDLGWAAGFIDADLRD